MPKRSKCQEVYRRFYMNNNQNYYLGLDMGTNSLGWTVTDENYNVLKNKGKAMWGIRLFEEASTAAERRIFRSSRRRLQRRKNRTNLLQEIFKEEIDKIDPNFFQRLKDSKYYFDDKDEFQINALFNDEDYIDKNYHEEFRTIYHLRKALIEDKKEFDIRLVYLAIHHILKKRGHFLFQDQNMNNVTVFSNVYNDLSLYLYDELNIDINVNNTNEIENILKDNSTPISKKERALIEVLGVDKSDKQIKAILGLMVGATKKLSDLYDDPELTSIEKPKVKFTDSSFDENRDELESTLHERIYLLDKLKAIYDWSILSEILKGKEYLSYAKVEVYDKHKRDLIRLKEITKKYYPEKYNEIFKHNDKNLDNYSAYAGITTKSNKKIKSESSCTQEELCKYLQNIFKNIEVNEETAYVMNEIEDCTLLPKQVNKDNGVIPYQVHEEELKIILENTSKYLTFLNESVEGESSNKEKILKLFKFRIPYYVGPLNDAHKDKGGNCWIVKKNNRTIYPWNFEEIVDIEASAEAFIYRMTNNCTYLFKETVLPKNSLIYSEYMVLNELNNLRVNHEKIDNLLKIRIFNDLFLNYKRVTQKRLLDYLKSEGMNVEKEDISGIDGDFKSSLTSYVDFKNILGDRINKYENQKIIENIIEWIVLYGEDKNILKRKIQKEYFDLLNSDDISKIVKLKYTGWGNFSRKFLTQINGVDKETGETGNIIEMLRNTNNNLMMLLSKQFTYLDEIEAFNNKFEKPKDITYELVEDLYVSPAVKHMLWQTMKVVKEVVKMQGKQPEKIFLEMARAEDKEKKRTQSRKNKLLELYKSCKEEQRNWSGEIESRTENDFRRDRLYLYYTQKGRCMYTGEEIDLDYLFDKNRYDIDHIHPQSKVKDDSLSNRVLVNRESNAEKGDRYPIPRKFQEKQSRFWYMLYNENLIDKNKYERLVRKTEFTDMELANFISRQIVETRQSSKAAADLFKRVYENTEIVYVKANLVSDFRKKYSLLKCREVNDYHHAKDAYLNVVVGNAYNARFTSNPYAFIKNLENKKYTLNHLFDYDIKRNGKIFWEAGNNGTIGIVKKYMNKNNILFTKATYEGKGGFFNQTIYDKKTCKIGTGYIPLKLGDEKLKDTTRYGGHGYITGAYFFVVEHTEKKKRVRTIETVWKYRASEIDSVDKLVEYSRKELGLVDPVIIYKKIKIQSLAKIDGYFYNITGRTGNQLLVSNAVELCLPQKMNDYIRDISKYINKNTEAKKVLKITDYDNLSRRDNEELYYELLKKHRESIFSKRKNSIGELLLNGEEKFEQLSIENQVIVLREILLLSKSNNLTADLRLIGGSKKTGVMRVSKNLNNKEFTIINQSPTGMFTNEVDLLK